MTCPDFDWKGFVLEEIPAPERRRMEEHLATCAACAADVEGLRLTLTALRRVPEREIPRRISFVSDPVFEPSWWSRLWNSAPRLGFASAAMLSLAIVAHGVVARPAAPAAPVPGVSQAQVEAQVEQEVAKRLDAAVGQRVQTELKPAVAELSAKLQVFERQTADRRRTDLRDVNSAFGEIDKRLRVMYINTARNGGD